MAIYHLRAKIIGRSSGKSAIAAAAYRAAESLYSEYQGLKFDYSRKKGVSFSEILLPDHAPAWMQEREKLWNSVELFEKRKDSTYAREVEVALPIELSHEQQKELLREYITENFIKLGMVADYSIHDADGNNPHAHIMLTLRPIVDNSFGKKERSWNDKRLFETWREQWAEVSNKHLMMTGSGKRISHLSYADLGIDLEPTMHRGFMTQKSRETLDRFQMAKEIKERNYVRLCREPNIALDILTYHEAVFNHQDIAKFVNERTSNLEEFNALKLAIETCDDIVHLGSGLDGKEYYTSKKMLELETNLVACSKKMTRKSNHRLNSKRFGFVLASRTLNEEQKKAFDHVLSGNNLSLVVGFAGTGKSYLMDAIREAYESQGYKVAGTALTGKAADGLQQSARINSRTIARYLFDWQNGREKLTDKTILIIDEAGMVGTRQFYALLTEAEKAGAKVIACGDPEQLPPIEAGCAFRFLLERTKHVFLKNVVRQKKDWQRDATVELSTHRHGKAIDRYNDHGFVCAHETRETAMQTIIKRWNEYQDCNPNKTSLIMAYRRVDVLAMNLMARELLLENNRISKKQFTVETAQFGKLEMSIGDHIMFLRNEKSINVKNGSKGKIEQINNGHLTVKLEQGDRISFDTNFYNDIGYGYAATVHKAQGLTVDQSFVLATKHFNKFLANVALDRHRDNVELHYAEEDFASFDNLKRTLSRGDSKALAIEFAKARGIDYELRLDEASEIQSQKDFTDYHEEIIAESVPIKNTFAEIYLKKMGVENIELNNVRFHQKVWEKETQSYMPALIAKAVGQGRKGLETKGVQVTFLNEQGDKAELEFPVRYSGSPDAIIMLQKPTKKDDRWFIATDIETALQVTKAKPDVRVACLATQERFDNVPLSGANEKELILCFNENSGQKIIDRAVDIFTEKQFKVSVATITENKLLMTHTHKMQQDIEQDQGL